MDLLTIGVRLILEVFTLVKGVAFELILRVGEGVALVREGHALSGLGSAMGFKEGIWRVFINLFIKKNRFNDF